eukprot:UN01135
MVFKFYYHTLKIKINDKLIKNPWKDLPYFNIEESPENTNKNVIGEDGKNIILNFNFELEPQDVLHMEIQYTKYFLHT